MTRIGIRFFQRDDGICPLLDWLDAIKPRKAMAKVLARIQVLVELGQDIRRPHADYLEDGIYELRERYIKVQYRMLFFFSGQGEAVITHGFTKPDAAVDKREIRRAIEYREAFLRDPEKHTYHEAEEDE